MAVYLGGAGTRPEWVPGKAKQRGWQESGLVEHNVSKTGKECDRPVQGLEGDFRQEAGTAGYMADRMV